MAILKSGPATPEASSSHPKVILPNTEHAFKVSALNKLSRLNTYYSNPEHAALINALLNVLLDQRTPQDVVHEISIKGYPFLGK
jgi:hypothetical protein